MWGGPAVEGKENPEDNTMLNWFGVYQPYVTMGAFVAAAIAQAANRPNIARVISAVAMGADMGNRILGIISFLMNDDTGGMLGMGFHSLLTTIMFMIANTIIHKLSRIQHLLQMIKGGGIPSADKISSLQGTFSRIKGVFEIMAYIYLASMLYTNPGSLLTFGGLLVPLYFLGFLDTTAKKAATLSTLAALSFLFPSFGGIVDLSDTVLPYADLLEGMAQIPIEALGSTIMSLGLGFLISTIDQMKTTEKESWEYDEFSGACDVDAISGPMTKLTTTTTSPTTRILKYYTLFTTIMSSVSFGAFIINSGMHNAMENIIISSASYPYTDWDPIMSPFDDPPEDPNEIEKGEEE